ELGHADFSRVLRSTTATRPDPRKPNIMTTEVRADMRKTSYYSLCALILCVITGTVLAQTTATKSASTKKYTAPKTSWGDPDLQGVWTGDDFYGVPTERPAEYGNRRYLTDEEYAARAKEVDVLATAVQNGDYPKAGYWARQKGVDAKAVPTNWT